MKSIIWIFLISSLFIPLRSAQTSDPIDEALQTQIANLEAYTSTVRGLSLNRELGVRFPTRAQVTEHFEAELGTAFTEELVEEAMAFYTGFDLLEPGTDLVGIYTMLITSQVAGYYDPEVGEMNVILSSGETPGSRLPVLEQIIYVHEFVHALQDQNFGLARFLEDPDASSDQIMAAQALFEGDATLVMNAYLQALTEANPLTTLASLLLGGLQAGNLTLPPGVPAILESELLWPYTAGEQFVRALIDEGGWDLVNAAFENPPVSSAQIFYPELYLQGITPAEVTLPEFEGPEADAWRMVSSGRLGTFYLREYLGTQLNSVEASAATAGWRGDAYSIYLNDAGETLIQLGLRFEDAAAQDDFTAAFAEFASLRTEASADELGCWEGTTRTLCQIIIDEDDLLLIMAPDLALAQALLPLAPAQ